EAAALEDALRQIGAAIERAIFVSVADDAVNQTLAKTLSGLAGEHWRRFVSTRQVAELRNDYAQVAQLGADRLAAALGAWRRVERSCLVVNCGTATTIDLVERLIPASGAGQPSPGDCQTLRGGDSLRSQKNSADVAVPRARFAGGVILPGLSLMKSALRRNTARLPDAAGRVVAVPDNTDDAIETGCLLAQVGAVEAMWRQFADPLPVLLAGGAAGQLRDALQARGMGVVEAPELVLEGLAAAILQRFS
ncbi:MAG TPA: type III pantothenate kinase, partial [Rhodocyclaceae bacterium]|nr:type III pantothenate kinase [Rhodocyclaceae bacterium]